MAPSSIAQHCAEQLSRKRAVCGTALLFFGKRQNAKTSKRQNIKTYSFQRPLRGLDVLTFSRLDVLKSCGFSTAVLEELHSALVALGGLERIEGAQVFPLAGA